MEKTEVFKEYWNTESKLPPKDQTDSNNTCVSGARLFMLIYNVDKSSGEERHTLMSSIIAAPFYFYI